MSMPFFSVVIPTKNRSALVALALQSLIRQSFQDFEVVVVDNDDTTATRDVVASFRDSRIKHVRTGGLSMPDNWEIAFQKAEGEYVCLLEDKQAFKGRALARLYEEIKVHQPESVKWRCDAFDDEWDIPRIRRDPGAGRVEWQTSDELLAAFVSSKNLNYKSILPLPQRGCLQRKLMERICAGPVQRLCPPLSPDVRLALSQLAYTDRVLDISVALTIYTSHRHSNGRSFALKGDLSKQFMRELGGDQGIFFSHVPIKAITAPGGIYNDYLKAQCLMEGRLSRHELHVPNYFVQCLNAMRESEAMGVNMSEELDEWRRALAEQPPSVQQAVSEVMHGQNQADPATRQSIMGRIGNAIRSPKLEKQIKSWLKGRVMRNPEWCFKSAIEYLEWEDTTPGISKRA